MNYESPSTGNKHAIVNAIVVHAYNCLDEEVSFVSELGTTREGTEPEENQAVLSMTELQCPSSEEEMSTDKGKGYYLLL